jgi:hypothetical protein
MRTNNDLFNFTRSTCWSPEPIAKQGSVIEVVDVIAVNRLKFYGLIAWIEEVHPYGMHSGSCWRSCILMIRLDLPSRSSINPRLPEVSSSINFVASIYFYSPTGTMPVGFNLPVSINCCTRYISPYPGKPCSVQRRPDYTNPI